MAFGTISMVFGAMALGTIVQNTTSTKVMRSEEILKQFVTDFAKQCETGNSIFLIGETYLTKFFPCFGNHNCTDFFVTVKVLDRSFVVRGPARCMVLAVFNARIRIDSTLAIFCVEINN